MTTTTTPVVTVRSVRLTNAVREKIVGNALAASFAKTTEALLAEGIALSGEVYTHFVGPQDRERIVGLGRRWFNFVTSRGINCGGLRLRLDFGTNPVAWPLSGEWTLAADHPLAVRLRDHAVRQEKHLEEREAAKRKLAAFLGSIGSSGALLDHWPDGRPFYEFALQGTTPAATVPACTIDDVNAALGLTREPSP